MSDITRTRPNADQMDRLIENVKAVADAVYAESDMSFLAMLDEITDGDEILPALCRGILRAKAAGIYNGAYEAVKLAVK